MKRPERRFAEPLTEAEKLRLATNPGVWSHERSFLGSRRVERPRECQIALRFPRPEGTPRTLDTPHLEIWRDWPALKNFIESGSN